MTNQDIWLSIDSASFADPVGDEIHAIDTAVAPLLVVEAPRPKMFNAYLMKSFVYFERPEAFPNVNATFLS